MSWRDHQALAANAPCLPLLRDLLPIDFFRSAHSLLRSPHPSLSPLGRGCFNSAGGAERAPGRSAATVASGASTSGLLGGRTRSSHQCTLSSDRAPSFFITFET